MPVRTGGGGLEGLRSLMGNLGQGAAGQLDWLRKRPEESMAQYLERLTAGAAGTGGKFSDIPKYMDQYGLAGLGADLGSSVMTAPSQAFQAAKASSLGQSFGRALIGQEGMGTPKPPVLSGPTEHAVLPGPKVSEAAPRKVPDLSYTADGQKMDPSQGFQFRPGVAQRMSIAGLPERPPAAITGMGQQSVQAPAYPQVPIRQLPSSGLNLGSPEGFQGIGGTDLGLPTVQGPGRGARGLQALKEIFGPGGSVDWEFNIPDTGITLAPGQTRRQRAGAFAGREAEADIAATQAGTLKDLSQAGAYELEADPDFQRFKLMQPALAAALLEEGRNKRFDIGRQVSEKDVYLGEGMDRRTLAQLQGRAENVATQGTFAGINKQIPSGGDLMRNAIAIRQQYDKLALEQGPEAAERFRASMVAADPRLAAHLPPPSPPEPSWLDQLLGR